MRRIYIPVMLVVGVMIVFISLSRASLEINAREEREGRVRGEVVEVEMEKDNGEKIKEVYPIPQVKMLPTNIFYGIKEVRDYLWLQFSRSNLDKARIAILLADKKIAESIVLAGQGQQDKAVISGEKAVEKLEYAWTRLGEGRDNRSIDLRQTISRAAAVYGQVIKEMAESESNRNKYEAIANKIEKFKEKEKTVD